MFTLPNGSHNYNCLDYGFRAERLLYLAPLIIRMGDPDWPEMHPDDEDWEKEELDNLWKRLDTP